MAQPLDNNVAKEFNIGKTHVKICTDYCVKNTAEIKRILDDIARNSLPSINSSALKENS